MVPILIILLLLIGFIIILFISIGRSDDSYHKDTTYYNHYNHHNHQKRYKKHNQHFTFWDDNTQKTKNNHSGAYSDPFDNHWETSFDWKDDDGDGYDDRDDGFWGGQEF